MTRLISLEKDYDIKLSSQVAKFLNPDFIYIPISNKRIASKKSVLKGEEVFLHEYSSVSGEMLGISEFFMPNGSKASCLKIANDLEEKTSTKGIRKKINTLTKEEMLESIFDEDLKKRLNRKRVSTILISGIDDEPYLANEGFIQKENTKCILETVDALMHVFKDAKAIIAIKSIDSENILAYTNFLGTYHDIELRLVDDLYLIGQEIFLREQLSIKKDCLYLKASEVYSLYTFLKKRKPKTEKYVTITGNGISNPLVILTKIGVNVKDLYSNFFTEDLEKLDVYVNGIMQGKKMDISDLLVTNDFLGLVIMKKEEKKKFDCIRCGKCISVCPLKKNPMLAYKNKKNIDCIHCGLCSYICPSYLPLRRYISGDNDE